MVDDKNKSLKYCCLKVHSSKFDIDLYMVSKCYVLNFLYEDNLYEVFLPYEIADEYLVIVNSEFDTYNRCLKSMYVDKVYDDANLLDLRNKVKELNSSAFEGYVLMHSSYDNFDDDYNHVLSMFNEELNNLSLLESKIFEFDPKVPLETKNI